MATKNSNECHRSHSGYHIHNEYNNHNDYHYNNINYDHGVELEVDVLASKNKSRAEKNHYYCTFEGCSLKFDRPSRLQWHLRYHTGEKPYKCEIQNCTKAYATSTKLKRHQKTFHKVTSGGAQLINGTPGELPSTPTDHGLVHQVSGISLITSGACSVSGQNGSARNNSGEDANLTNQRSSNTPCSFSEHKYKCTEEGCGKSFRRRSNLYNHKVMVHEKRATFRCTFEGCNQTFTFSSRLKRHLKSHEGYTCKECDQKFSKWTDVRAHVASQHKKIHSCSSCSKTFKRPCDLHRHELTHASLKEMYTCIHQGCSKSYDRVATLRKHIKAQHHGELPYKCDQCPATFPHLVNLNRHVKFHSTQAATTKKQYPAKAHRKVPVINRLAGVILPSDCGAAQPLPAACVSGAIINSPSVALVTGEDVTAATANASPPTKEAPPTNVVPPTLNESPPNINIAPPDTIPTFQATVHLNLPTCNTTSHVFCAATSSSGMLTPPTLPNLQNSSSDH